MNAYLKIIELWSKKGGREKKHILEAKEVGGPKQLQIYLMSGLFSFSSIHTDSNNCYFAFHLYDQFLKVNERKVQLTYFQF